MTATADLPGFYRGVINLWVEDTLTRDYLRKAWKEDPVVLFFVGGGNEGVKAVVNEAESAGLRNVFAFVDRDLGTTNRPDWADAAKTARRFVSSVHEIENHLLDPDALSGCSLNTGGRSASDITTRLLDEASRRAWWLAARRVIARVRNTILTDFPRHPTFPTVVDQASSEAYLHEIPWWSVAQTYLPTLTNSHLTAELVSHHGVVSGWLTTSQWLTEFPGKELFRSIRDWVYWTTPPIGTPAMRDSDLGKAVGEWQAANNRVPQELTELLAALKTRAGVP